MISPGTTGSVSCRLTSGNPAQESPLGHGPQARPRARDTARIFVASLTNIG
jgi:hypothetical protein